MFRLLLLRVLLPLIVLAGLVVGTEVARASSEPHLRPGLGAWVDGHTDFVGSYRAHVGGRWVAVYCIDPDRAAPRDITLHTRSRLPGLNPATTRLLAETLAAHGDATSATQAEAVSQALNTEAGNDAAVGRRARFLPQQVLDLAERYVDEARHRHGPYTLQLRLPHSPLPGQAATGTVSLRAGRYGIAGTVTLRHTANVAAPARVRTNNNGRAVFAYRTLGGGAVHLEASTRVLPTTVRASTSDGSTQVMVSWSPRTRLLARATYQAHGPRFTHRYACTAECAGHPLVTLTACAPANRYASRVTFWYDGRSHRVDFPATPRRACASWQVRVPDAVSVSATWQFRTAHGWTPPIPAAGAFTVDCPAVPPVAVLLSYDCAHASLSATLGSSRDGALEPWHNASRHRVVLDIGGAVSSHVEVAPGSTASAGTFELACGTHATVTVRGGVQRADGSYNYGYATTVTTP